MGAGFPLKNKGRGRGGGEGGGWGRDRQGTGKSMRKRLSKPPFSDLPFSFSPIFVMGNYFQ